MEYIVSARKYRPMSFDSVVGQSALTTTLKNAVKTGKLAHAYLFCGPRGVGKTTCARIFARAINCQNPTQEGEACGSCESCKSFEEGRSYSIFELDAASNNSVEDIKTLMEQTRIPPQVGSYKVFIIDEVHMLSTAAFNAFLKTLEEPPAHVIFILATTEKHKLLPTIISRCQIYDFERMTVQNTIDHLKMVAEKEGYTYEEEALAVIAEKADGGMRDALSIFDQAASFCKGNITYEKVIEDLNVLDEENYFQIVDLAIANNVAEIMLLVNKVIARGFDGGNLCQGLASHIRNVMMGKDPKTMQLLECSAQHKARYVDQAQKCSTLFLYTALRILNQCDINYRQSSNKRLLVELSLIQVAQITQSEEEAPSAGRSPKRLKTLFKNIALQAKPKKTVQQVTEAKPVEFTASMSEQKSVVEKPVVSRSGLKLSSLGFTFAGVKKKEAAASSTNDEEIGTNEVGIIKEFSQDELELQWLSMCNRMQLTPEYKGLAARMKNILPAVKNYPDVEIVVENQQLLDEVRKLERRITSTLRMNLGNSEIVLAMRLAEPSEVKRILTKREMLEELKNTNQGMARLMSRFDLELV